MINIKSSNTTLIWIQCRKQRIHKGVFHLGKIYIEERAVNLAQYIIDSGDTVRGAAKKFGISKSTVHKDVSERLQKINPVLALEVRKILDENKAERHIRGGMATKMKYSHDKEQNAG